MTIRQPQSKSKQLNKLLTAFRAGMAMSRPIHGQYTTMRGKTCYACAIGTVLFGMGVRQLKNGKLIYRKEKLPATQHVNEMLPDMKFLCPGACWGREALPVGTVMEHLFEHHVWSRPKIERWLKWRLAELQAREV